MIKRLSTLAALAVGATCLFSPTAAQAAPANQCWTKVWTGETRCFTTFAAAVADLSGGEVKVSGGAAAFSTADASAVAVAAASYTAMVAYEDSSYGGASNIFQVVNLCDGDAAVENSQSLVGTIWNDRISSFKGYNGCDSKLWSNLWGGSSYGPTLTTTYVGATLNDEASSIQWS